MTREKFTNSKMMENVFTQPKRREEQMKKLTSMDILKLCDEHNVIISIYYGIGITIAICSETSDRRVARILLKEDLPDDEDHRLLYLSVVIEELIHLIEEDGFEISGIAKTTKGIIETYL